MGAPRVKTLAERKLAKLSQAEQKTLLGGSVLAIAKKLGISINEASNLKANPPAPQKTSSKPTKTPGKAKTVKKTTAAKAPAKKRRVSHAGAKEKGARLEREFVEFLRNEGIPSMRVLASGAYKGADADVKVGVRLKADGSYPEADEGACIMRVECKNRRDNPEYLHTALNEIDGVLVIPAPKDGAEILWDHLNQDAVTKAVVLRRAKVPSGAVTNEDWNQVGLVCMGWKDFAAFFKKAYGNELGL